MRLTRAAEYALRCVFYLAKQGRGVLVSRRNIADQAGIPAPFLAKIAQQLSRAGIVGIQQGAGGGYRLLMPPERVTMLEVIEIIIGEIFLNHCVGRPSSCANSPFCATHRVWCRAQDQLRSTLRQVSFADLVVEEDGDALPVGMHPQNPFDTPRTGAI